MVFAIPVIATLATAAWAQQAVRVNGTIAAVDGAMLTIKGRDGAEQKVRLTPNAAVIGVDRPWDRPNTTMTNATVDQKVTGVDGDVLTVKYKDGEKKIVVPPEAIILANTVSDRSELKPGASIGILRAVKQADGTFQADRINVGRGGVTP
jgi:hypothetical protein